MPVEKVFDEPNVNCCYAGGNKHSTKDPQGIASEAFHTLDSVPVYGDADEPAATSACANTATQCCGPAEETAKTARTKNACCALRLETIATTTISVAAHRDPFQSGGHR
jgi:hypothetical protein